jgi:hypothetical protein
MESFLLIIIGYSLLLFAVIAVLVAYFSEVGDKSHPYSILAWVNAWLLGEANVNESRRR